MGIPWPISNLSSQHPTMPSEIGSNFKSIPLSIFHPLRFFSTLFLQPLPSPPIFTTIDHVMKDAFVRTPQDTARKFLQWANETNNLCLCYVWHPVVHSDIIPIVCSWLLGKFRVPVFFLATQFFRKLGSSATACHFFPCHAFCSSDSSANHHTIYSLGGGI